MRLPASIRSKALSSMKPGDSIAAAVRPKVDPKRTGRLVIMPGLRAVSITNARGWRKLAQIAKEQRSRTFNELCKNTLPPLPVVVTLERFAPQLCDDDNLAGSLKHVRDGVADAYGIDDADPRIRFAVKQEKNRQWIVSVCIQVTP